MATVPDTAAELPEEGHAKPPFLRRVKIRNYKSIAYCDVPLGPLTVIVGRNGSGKSNFLDALAFLRDTSALTVGEAIQRHGGANAIRCRSEAEDSVHIELQLPVSSNPELRLSKYSFTTPLGESEPTNQPTESVTFADAENRQVDISRDDLAETLGKVLEAKFTGSEAKKLPSDLLERIFSANRSYLRFMSLNPAHPFGNFALRMQRVGVYNFFADGMRQPQRQNPGGLLERDGRNLADVFRQIQTQSPDTAQRVQDYLAAITEQVIGVEHLPVSGYETLRFKLDAGRGNPPLEFDAASMSDGTLRALAALVAVFQVLPGGGHPSLVGIEEPETALHPAASRALVDALDEATMHTQVVITTHSADILDDPDLEHATILVARYRNGRTELAPVDAASRESVRRELNTYGGRLRDDRLEPDRVDLARQERDAQSPPEG